MPKRKRSTRKYVKAKRSYKRKKMSRRRNVPRPQRSIFGAKSARQKLQYSDLINLPAVTGANISEYRFACNGMYDPDITGTGHQPHYFDQAMQFYDHFTVLGAKITVSGAANDNNTDMMVSIRTSDSGNSLGDAIDIMENKRSHYIYVPAYARGPNGRWSITQKFSASKFFGKSKSSIVNSDLYRGNVSGNPTELAYFVIEAWDVTKTAGLTNTPVTVTVQYYASFNEPKSITQS